MKASILIVLLTASLGCVAQNHYIGFKFGPSWTNAINFAANTTNRQTFSGGITYEYVLNKHLSLGADLIYSGRGLVEQFEVKGLGQTNSTATGHMYVDYTYVSLPLKIGYSVGDRIFGFGSLGVIPAIRTHASNDIPTIYYGNSGGLIVDTIDIARISEKFDLAGTCEIGLGYRLNNGPSLFTSFSFQRSFTSFSKNWEAPEKGDAYHYGGTWSIGLKYPLKKSA